MADHNLHIDISKIPEFRRNFLNSSDIYSMIDGGEVGGKAAGLIRIYNVIYEQFDETLFPDIKIKIPKFVVIGTDHFDNFMRRNNLYEVALSDITDERKILKFQEANLPVELLGDLRSIAEEFHTPLAVRSSSLLEDSLKEPFAGVYSTKMISNDQPDGNDRNEKLIEAVKYVYASTFFQSAVDYFKSTDHEIHNEKMAVIIQQVAGSNHTKRFYPTISGVIKSFNYYPAGSSKPEDGIVNLALGLGRTIVDGGISWTYTPNKPKAPAPFADPAEMMKNTQSTFWAINMDHQKEYNILKETEYLISLDLNEADYDNSLKYTASTFDRESNKIVMGVGNEGPRVINFSPLLKLNDFNFNKLITKLITESEQFFQQPVEIEFAMDIDQKSDRAEFSLLQIRPMFVSKDIVELTYDELDAGDTLISSNRAMGNGIKENISDVVFVKPDSYDKKYNPKIAEELEILNRNLLNEKKPYLLIGFGRWGSSDPWLGIPVNWGNISGAKVIVESTLPGINVDLSQGSHFFHNLSAYNVFYFSIHHELDNAINWEYFKRLDVVKELEFTQHVELNSPLYVKVDGRTCRGVIKNA